MMRSGQKGFGNDTTSSYGITGSFPHYKQIIMPADQKAKLLAMHRASRANAGIYVAVVLAVYVILLTMLLCRYAKRQRPSGENSMGGTPQHPHQHTQQQQQSSSSVTPPSAPFGFFRFSSRNLRCEPRGRGRSLCALICCPKSMPRDEPIHEIGEYPLSTMTTKIECPRPSTSSNSNAQQHNNGTEKPISV